MPSISAPGKIAATKEYGADVHISGPTAPERQAMVDELISQPEFHTVFVPPYNHPDVMLGQGTAGSELQEQAESLNAIMTPCGGGGLLSGTAISCQGSGIMAFQTLTGSLKMVFYQFATRRVSWWYWLPRTEEDEDF